MGGDADVLSHHRQSHYTTIFHTELAESLKMGI